MTQLETAELIVKQSFRGKTDRAGRPYIEHLERVKDWIVNDYPNRTDLHCIALLHDLLEDCPEWNEKVLRYFFSDRIVDAVVALTRKPEQNYDDYINQLDGSYDARLVKIRDLKDNMNITRLPKIDGNDWLRLQKYHKAYIFLTK